MALSPLTLRTGRIELRPFRADDLPLIEEASRDPLIPLITTVPADYTPAAGLAFIERQGDRLAADTGWSLAIVDLHEARAVGQVGLWVTNLDKGRAELGYWVAASARGHRYAALALDELSRWAFANTEVQRLTLYIEPTNFGSMKTAERCGYEREGLLRSWELVGDEHRDMWSYARFRDSIV